MKTEFACVAEAVAYYYNRGWSTEVSNFSTNHYVRRVMAKPGEDQLLCPMVEITKNGFLSAKVEFLG
jgi:hypothetical protein